MTEINFKGKTKEEALQLIDDETMYSVSDTFYIIMALMPINSLKLTTVRGWITSDKLKGELVAGNHYVKGEQIKIFTNNA